MPFWTVEDAGPYKEKSNFLMRTSLCAVAFIFKNVPHTNALSISTTAK